MRAIGKGPPVPRHLRNPRRGYDEEGGECEPATIASVQKNGARAIIARCACDHEAVLPFDRLDPSWYVPDVALRLRCSACGGKRILTYPDWSSGWRSGR